MQSIDLTMDFQYGSCGKGGVTGYLAKRRNYDAVVCSYGTQAGHSYNDKTTGLKMMVQQLPVGIICSTVQNVFIGPGALIHAGTLRRELNEYAPFMAGKRLFIHEHAAVVEDYHGQTEKSAGFTKIGSTAKGVGEAAIERIRRNPDNPNVVKTRFSGTDLAPFIASRETYDWQLGQAENLLVEGAQGFGLSMYHGDYPYCTSRDVTPWQIGADCGLPYSWAPLIRVIGAVRTFPIRVNNRDGSSGPCYPDQSELTWEEVGQKPELTTVTKLQRRIFNFSAKQMEHAAFHCCPPRTGVVVTFGDYCRSLDELWHIIGVIQTNPSVQVVGVCFGPDDADMLWLENVPMGSAMSSITNWYAKYARPTTNVGASDE